MPENTTEKKWATPGTQQAEKENQELAALEAKEVLGEDSTINRELAEGRKPVNKNESSMVLGNVPFAIKK